jgi:hypothetical protein
MDFTKESLSFLEVFGLVSNTKSFLNDKINIQSDEDKIYFSQYGDDSKLIYTMDNVTKENINVTYLINQLNSMIKSCNEGDIISITPTNLAFGKNSEYKFESYDFSNSHPKSYLKMINDNDNKKFNIIDLAKYNNVKKFIANEKELNCVSLQDNHFVSFNNQIIAVSKTENNIDEKLDLSPIFFTLVNSLGLKEVTLVSLQDSQFFYFNSNNLNVFLPINDYIIPFVFSDDVKEELSQPYFVSCDRNNFMNVLHRINIVSQMNTETRVYVSFEKDKMIIESIENKEGGHGKEIVEATVSKELEGFYVILSIFYLNSIVSLLKGNTITMNMKPNKDIKAIRIVDEKDTDYYVHLPFEYVD